ncbi:hypothetical protein BJY04DRAFT_27310 [Aspergillus karnatakaensis]|uniref:uncharacterized protein n=1 Tax=Aspergillus karnatakaensis TaxID=1810916 RepID=UPI003CCDE883
MIDKPTFPHKSLCQSTFPTLKSSLSHSLQWGIMKRSPRRNMVCFILWARWNIAKQNTFDFTGQGYLSYERQEPLKVNKQCQICGQGGHLTRDCEQPLKVNKSCHACGESGHLTRECSQGGSGGLSGSGGRQTTRSQGMTCYNCGEAGHISRDCPTET